MNRAKKLLARLNQPRKRLYINLTGDQVDAAISSEQKVSASKISTFRFKHRTVQRMEDIKARLSLSSKTEVLELALKSLDVLSNMADKSGKVVLKTDKEQVVLFLD